MNDSLRLEHLLDKANDRINTKEVDESKYKTEQLADSIYNLIEDCLKDANNFYNYIESVEKYKNLGTIVTTSNVANSYYRITDDEIDIMLNYTIEFGNNIFEEGIIPEIDVNTDYLNELLKENGIQAELITKPFRTENSQGMQRIYKITYQKKNKELKLKKN